MDRRHLRCLRGGEVWFPDGFRSQRTLVLEAGKIRSIQEGPAASPSCPGDLLDAADGIVIPGLVDLQVNGALGWSFQAGHAAHFDAIVGYHLAAGTTTFLPTLVTAEPETLLASLQVLAGYLDRAPASLPGIHLEGPFLAREKSGAHDQAALQDPDLALARQFEQAAQGRLRVLTLAPELPGALPIVEHFAGQGVRVSAGHSAATYAEMRRAIQAGLSFVTHAGNASDWPHRALGELGFLASEPGVVGALLAEPALAGSVILDGYHFHPALLPPLLRLKGPEHLVLVSDASTVAGSPPGDYMSGGLQVTVHPQGFATSGRGGGWLAGSTITLLDAVQRAVRLAGLSLHQAVALATLAPARFLGLDGHKGQIAPGCDADLLVLEQDLSLRYVIVGGRVIQGQW